MECLAHQAYKLRSETSLPSLEPVKQAILADPERCKSVTAWPVDLARTLSRDHPQDQKPHIGIVGAGISGLRCARKLSESGCQVTILEARDRVGGRVHQSRDDGRAMDLGPNWIHGSKGNPILALANRLQNVLYEPPQDKNVQSPVYDPSGKAIDSQMASKYSAVAWELIDQAMKYSEAESPSISPGISLADFLLQALQLRGYDSEKTRLIMCLADMWSNIVGEPMELQSLKYLWLEQCIEGENWYLASTYKTILEEIHAECKDRVDIRFNAKVTRIVSNSSSDNAGKAISLTIEGGGEVQYDEIIVTVPLGWLKHNRQSFTPPLPHNMINAIDHIGYGRLEKVYITFERPFWQEAGSSESSPFVYRFLKPNYATEHNPGQRTLECVSLAALPQPCQQSTLLFYLNGPTSEYVTKLVRDLPQGSKERHATFVACFAPYYSRLPNFDETLQPTEFCSTDWQNDELAGYGSYSTYQVSDDNEGLVELDKDIEILRVGCPERNLWFAGEHTAPTLALGTTTGAYWSGEAVAERLLRVYNL